MIEFQMDGTIIRANENYLRTFGYTEADLEGKNHSVFVTEKFRNSAEYRQFWRDLNDGKFQAAEYKRIGKGGREVWIQASYNPIFGPDGRPFKVVKFGIRAMARSRARVSSGASRGGQTRVRSVRAGSIPRAAPSRGASVTAIGGGSGLSGGASTNGTISNLAMSGNRLVLAQRMPLFNVIRGTISNPVPFFGQTQA